MKKVEVTFNSYVCLFKLGEREIFENKMSKLESKGEGKINEIYINNGYGFQYIANKKIM